MRAGEKVTIHTADGTEFEAVIDRVTCVMKGRVTGIEVTMPEGPKIGAPKRRKPLVRGD